MATIENKSKNSQIDIRQSKEYGDFLRGIGWVVEDTTMGQVFVKKIPILGSAIKIQRTNHVNLSEIKKLQRKYRSFLTIIEPEVNLDTEEITKAGYKLTNSSYLPTKTLIIDISASLPDVLLSIKKDARYGIRKSENEKIVEVKDVEEFRNNWKKAVSGKLHVLSVKHLISLKNAFSKNIIFTQTVDGSAGGIFIVSGKTGYYWVGFYGDSARKRSASYQIIWNGISWCKKRGATKFDFEGIIDERFPRSGWSGFSHFKKSFGGEQIYYPGCFVKWF